MLKPIVLGGLAVSLLLAISHAHDKVNLLPDSPFTITRCKTPNSIALTFDDGPSEHTPALLDLLKKEDVRATFFIVGNALSSLEHKKTCKRTFDEGHLIGSHTFTHPWIPNLSDAQIKDELSKTEAAIDSIIGFKVQFLRPPFGAMDERSFKLIKSMGYEIVNWNVDSNDWRYEAAKSFSGMEDEFKLKVQTAKKNNESIIALQHDTISESVKSTKEFIRVAKEAGYTFLRVDECLEHPSAPQRKKSSQASRHSWCGLPCFILVTLLNVYL
jgi:peptidoglycan/xylan/chitin deacetylase (PgdA/CDA1 family)